MLKRHRCLDCGSERIESYYPTVNREELTPDEKKFIEKTINLMWKKDLPPDLGSFKDTHKTKSAFRKSMYDSPMLFLWLQVYRETDGFTKAPTKKE